MSDDGPAPDPNLNLELDIDAVSQVPATLGRHDALEADVRVGDFVIERRLGAGGMGIVYQARQLSLDRVVALKVLGDALNRPDDIARFRREAQAVARLDHPHIAGVHYVGQDRQLCYMAMEYVDGASLRRVLNVLERDPGASVASALDSLAAGEVEAPVVRFDDPTATMISTTTEKTPLDGGHPAQAQAARPPRSSTSAAPSRSSATPPWRWRTRTSGGWSTATSSRRTCCSTARGRSA